MYGVLTIEDKVALVVVDKAALSTPHTNGVNVTGYIIITPINILPKSAKHYLCPNEIAI